MKKLLKPLGWITLIILIGGLIFGIVRLFQGSDDWGLQNKLILEN